MTVQRIKEHAKGNGLRLTTLIGVATLLAMCFGGIWKMAPMLAMPEKVESLIISNKEILRAQSDSRAEQAVTTSIQKDQAEAIKRIADFTEEIAKIRIDVRANDQRLREHDRRLDRLESRP